MPSPSCVGSNLIDFIYDHAGVRKIKSAATPTIYPNQYYTDFGGGSGSQFKHIFIGSERILTKKTRIAPDRQHWYYHPDHLGSTAMVTNENSQMVDAVHYFPFGEVWFEEVPSALSAGDYFFTAKEFDPETGFYYFGARYLDPRFSKWMTADPGLGSYLNGQPNSGVYKPFNLSLYGYASNNPASAHDPDGRFVNLLVGGVTSVAIGYGIAKLTGQEYSWTQAGIDFGVGVATSGAGAVVKAVQVARALKAGQQAVGAGARTVESALASKVGTATRAGEAIVGETVAAGEAAATKAESKLLSKVCGSFAETTPVTTREGLKPIGDVKTGERVLARSEVTGAYTFEPVTQVYSHQDPVKVRLTLEDPATGAAEVVETTPEHLFYMPGLGFVEAAALTPGDPVSRAPSAEPPVVSVVRLINLNDLSDTLRVEALTLEHQPFWAYNLEVAQDHTFFVGASRAWVHNAGSGCSLFERASSKADEAAAAGGDRGAVAVFKAAGEEEVTTGLSSGAAKDIAEKVVQPHPELYQSSLEMTLVRDSPLPAVVVAWLC